MPSLEKLASEAGDPPSADVQEEIRRVARERGDRDPYRVHAEVGMRGADVTISQVAWVLAQD